MYVPFKVESGKTPRKLEIERRKRHYAKQSIDELLRLLDVDTKELMPVSDCTAQALSYSAGDEHPTPVFPSYLPLEVFDNTEFECRTPEEWVELGMSLFSYC